MSMEGMQPRPHSLFLKELGCSQAGDGGVFLLGDLVGNQALELKLFYFANTVRWCGGGLGLGR